MTASVPVATSFSYTGDGSTTGFSFPLRFLENADVQVYVDGALKTITTHYTLSGAGGPSGGTVAFVVAPAAAADVELRRATLAKQTVDLSDSGRTPGDTLEAQLDRLAMAGQDAAALLEDVAQEVNDLGEFGVPAPDVLAVIAAYDDDVRESLATPLYVATRTALKAVDTTKDTVAILTEAGREGTFVFMSGNYTARVAVDTQEGVFVKATAISAGVGCWVRVYATSIAPEWFGAHGDNSTDDYTALQAAFTFAWTYGVILLLGKKTYKTGTRIDIASLTTASGNKLTVRGHGRLSSVISGAVSTAVIQVGNVSNTAFSGYLEFSDFGITAFAGSTPAAGINPIDLVRATFRGMRFSACTKGVFNSGGIAILYDDCDFDGNVEGLYADNFASLAAGGYSNYILMDKCRVLNNTMRGVNFTAGRMLVMTGCEVEGNGTAGQVGHAGVQVSSDIGSEASLTYAYGAIIRDCWFEDNASAASIALLSGTNVIEDCYFVNNTDATYDIYIGGGAYRIDGTQHDSTKTTHIVDEGTTSSRNFLNNARKADGTRANILVAASRCYMPDLGVPQSKQIVTVQGSAVALTNNITTAQSVFAAANDTLTVEAATTYRFRAKISLNTGATSHTTAFGFGGSATFTSVRYDALATSSAADTLATPQVRRVAAATAAVLTAASTAVTTDIWIDGIMRVNAAGTIIPQITFSAGPTGTCETAINSYFELEPLGSNTLAAVGPWA